MSRTLQQLAQEVLDVQDACNLSGVVLAWGRSISELRSLLDDKSTDAINKHPINVMWASKVESLTRCDYTGVLSDSITEVAALANCAEVQ